MIQGIYLASQGMTMLMQKQDQIANNLANINTTGYKESGLFAKELNKCLADTKRQPYVNMAIKPDEVYVDYSEGAPRTTGNPMDLLVKGSGFFTVMTPNGVGYTRNGNFSSDPDGFLVNSEGWKVMSKEGYIKLDQDAPAPTVTGEGEVLQGNETKGILRIVDFEKPYNLLRMGTSCFIPKNADETKPIQSPGYVIRQGFLESSNVNIIKNMVEMIAAYRNFEADQRALLAQDQTLDKAANQVGRI